MIKTLDNHELVWAGIDFDGVLADNSGWPDFEILEPLDGAKEAMEKMEADGWKLTIYTARPWADYQKIEDWLIKHGIPFRRIICGKPLFRFMIDDRNIEFNGKWQDALKKIPKK